MDLRINGRMQAFAEPLTVAELLVRLGLPRDGIAVERNREIVRRKDYDATEVRDGDELEIVTLVGGG